MEFGFPHACRLIGGLALFIYGMGLASDGLKRSAGGRMRAILGFVTRNRLAGLAVGIALTVLLQSSSALTVMLVGLADAGLITTLQATSVILGSDVGTTLTIQLIAFELANYALLAIALGVVMTLVGRSKRVVYLGRLLVGLGLVFFGMYVMKGGVAPLKNSEQFVELLARFARNPVLGVLAATVVTAVIQSSAATVAFVLTLVAEGVLGLDGAVPLIFGANIGTCATALLSAVGSERAGWRIAVAHLLFKVLGVCIFLPFVGPFTELVLAIQKATGGSEVRAVANAHTLFNVANAVIFLPFVPLFASLMERVVPERSEGDRGASLYLEEHPTSETYVEVRRLFRELAHMADHAARLVGASLEGVLGGGAGLEKLRSDDEEIDGIHRQIIHYASELASREVTVDETNEIGCVVTVTRELEQACDLVSKNLVELGRKLEAKEGSFSMAGIHDLRGLHGDVAEGVESLAACIAREEAPAPGEVAAREERVAEMLRRTHREHFDRIAKGVLEAKRTDAIFTDTANCLRQIHRHVWEIDMALRGEEGGDGPGERGALDAFGRGEVVEDGLVV